MIERIQLPKPNEKGEFVILRKGKFVILYYDPYLQVDQIQVAQNKMIENRVDLRHFKTSNICYQDKAVLIDPFGGIEPTWVIIYHCV